MGHPTRSLEIAGARRNSGYPLPCLRHTVDSSTVPRIVLIVSEGRIIVKDALKALLQAGAEGRVRSTGHHDPAESHTGSWGVGRADWKVAGGRVSITGNPVAQNINGVEKGK